MRVLQIQVAMRVMMSENPELQVVFFFSCELFILTWKRHCFRSPFTLIVRKSLHCFFLSHHESIKLQSQ